MDDVYPLRQHFKALVLAHRKANRLTPQDMAAKLGVKPSYLHGLLYDKRVEMSLDVAQRASGVLGVSISELLDDPGGTPPPGISPSDYAGMTEEDRVYLRGMGSDFMALTQEQKKAAFTAALAVFRAIRGT